PRTNERTNRISGQNHHACAGAVSMGAGGWTANTSAAPKMMIKKIINVKKTLENLNVTDCIVFPSS
ncbi:MAG: hypothetical protein KAJ59_00895, partial [Thermodesulfovibrionia bacterium]|nr:hypothetical protein [Thermodesulfovibrionia bacterium]